MEDEWVEGQLQVASGPKEAEQGESLPAPPGPLFSCETSEPGTPGVQGRRRSWVETDFCRSYKSEFRCSAGAHLLKTLNKRFPKYPNPLSTALGFL